VAQFLSYFMLFLLSFLSFLLIVIVLLQRGRGGGLAGALGGAGGQSAFGTKAGDVFTKITVGMAIIWVLVAGLSINVLSWSQSSVYEGGADANSELTLPGGEEPSADRPAADLGEDDEPNIIPDSPVPGPLDDSTAPADNPEATPSAEPAGDPSPAAAPAEGAGDTAAPAEPATAN